MKIIAKGNQRITCPRCGAILEYEYTDIKRNERYSNDANSTYIDCPVCYNDIAVPEIIKPISYNGYYTPSLTITDTDTIIGQPYDIFQRDGIYCSAIDATTAVTNTAFKVEGATPLTAKL